MDDFLIIAGLSLVYAWVLVVLPCVILIAVANVAYRLASGRFFRWLSWRTGVPVCVVLIVGWVSFYNMLKGTALFVITH